MTISAPGGVGAALGEMLFLAGQSLDVAGPLLAVDALHRLAFVVRFDPGELAVLHDRVSNEAVGLRRDDEADEHDLRCKCLADEASLGMWLIFTSGLIS